MKTLLTSALIVGLMSFSAVGLVGCAEEAKQETKEVTKTPDGTNTTTVTKDIKTTGDNPPANSAGEKAK
jgi:hypothetical protein